MKKYRAIELILTTNTVEPPESTDFGKKAAVTHRILKGSWEGSKTKSQGFKSKLGAGAFKKVYEIPGAPGTVSDVDFVLAKLLLEQDSDIQTKAKIGRTMFELLATMYIYGIPRMTTWIASVDKLSDQGFNDLTRRMVLYLPRVNGRELKESIGKDAAAIELNQRIRWFNQICSQVRDIHRGRLFLGDLKPANIMADAATGVTLIDFGGVNRPWLLPRARTPAYDIRVDRSTAYFERAYLASLGTPMPPVTKSALLEATRQLVLASDALNTAARQYRRDIRASGIYQGLWGVYYDTYAIAIMALEMKLVDSTNLHAFTQIIQQNFRPFYVQNFLNELCARYTLDPGTLDKPSPFHLLSAINGIRVRCATSSMLDPEPLIKAMKNQHIKELGKEVILHTIDREERERRAEALGVFEDAMALFRVFSSIPEVYQVAGGVGGRKTVDSKHQAMTALINQLSWTYDATSLGHTITRLFAASLVNRSIINREITTSFEALVRHAKAANIVPLIQTYWSPMVNSAITLSEFREFVLDKAKLLAPVVEEEGAFKKSHRYDTLTRIVDSAVALAPEAPAKKENVIAAINLSLSTARLNVQSGPLRVIERMRLAGQTNRDSGLDARQNVLSDEWAATAGSLAESSFHSFIGTESTSSIDEYNLDLDTIYTSSV
jgi:serine/threonine protein kinase